MTKQVLAPEWAAQLLMEYARGRERHKQELLAGGYGHDELLDQCAGLLQLVDLQKNRLNSFVELLGQWQSSNHESVELIGHTASLIEEMQSVMPFIKAQLALRVEGEKADALRRELLARAGSKGAATKNKKATELKYWALREAESMHDSHAAIARKLSARVPIHLANASVNPERLIYDALRSEKNRIPRQAG
ncbi:hypothetical protein [Ottowia thiooxydans]|uniref:hypothetical protein n=1 Tax=Ottowia thiooxydans TaxID=219182 RepID=UPI0012EC2957|nr:hypothetical protein [Ottowia thiooxydans]